MKILNNFLILFIVVVLFGCSQNNESAEGKIIIDYWSGTAAPSLDKYEAEINEKIQRLNKFMDENGLGGMLFTQVRNVYWITGGKVNTQIVLNKDVGAASLLVMRSGKKYLVCSGSESGRLLNESMKGLGYELKQYNWYEANPVKDVRGGIIKGIAGSLKIGSDADFPNTVLVAEKFRPVRYTLTEQEMERYRWLGEQCTEAVSEVCRKLKPGMDEYEIEAMTATALRARGIIPTVLLMAADERIFNYRHALPGGAKVKKYAMVNIVAEKWGMPVAVTRFVHFGPLPEELKNKLEQTAIINACYEEATAPGKPVSEIFEGMKNWYAKAGFEGEWMKHHQGGSIGYDDREYVIYPGNKNIIQNNQAFAWNPTITGAKVEETIIAHENGIEVITKSKDWPVINVELNGRTYPQPAILLRDAETGELLKQDAVTIKAEK
jgi:antitoxin VapB